MVAQPDTVISDPKARLTECYRVITDFLRFVRIYCWIEAKDTNEAIPFALWPEQEAVTGMLYSTRLLVVLKARQLGLTWLVACYCLWMSITRPLQLIVIISSKEDTAKEFLARVKFILARLPDWLRAPIERETTEEIEFRHVDRAGNKINSIIKSLPTTPSGAQSKTPTVLVIDEAHESRDVGRLYAASKPGIDAAKGQVIVIANAVKDTPGWPWVRGIFTGAMTGANDFRHVFLPWWAHPGRSREPVEDLDTGKPIPRFKHEQIRGGMDEDDFSQHYPETAEEAISVLGGSYFGSALKRHTKTCRGVMGTLKRDTRTGEIEFTPDRKGIIEVWRYPYHLVKGWDGEHWSRRYAMGADVSEGLGQSYSVAYVLDRHLDEMVCRIRSNRIDAGRWADLLALVGEWYMSVTEWTRLGGVKSQKAVICVERTGAGHTTVERLRELKANQYVRMIEDQIGGGVQKAYGWNETEQSKHDLCEDLRSWFRTMTGTLYCAVLLDEASTWIKHEGSRKLGPEEGHFGDCVMAAGCTVQASHFLGGKPERVKAPDTGWMAKYVEKKESRTGWTV